MKGSATTINLMSINAESWDSLQPAFQSIVLRDVKSLHAFETMILDWNVLDAYVGDTIAEIMVGASLNSADRAAQSRKKYFLEHLQPRLEVAANDFAIRVLNLNEEFRLPEHYHLMLHILASERSLFRPENPPLNSKVNQLSQQYDTTMGRLSIVVRGHSYTPPQINAPMNTADRTLREDLWRGLWSERLRVAQEVDQIFSEQIELRHLIARNAGFQNFRDYSFQKMRRFYYTAADAKRLHDSIEKHIVPISRARYQKHANKLGLTVLRPWDIGGGRFHEVFVKPYAKDAPALLSSKEVEEVTAKILQAIDPDMALQFEEMRTRI